MFTGIIETTGTLLNIQENGGNKTFIIESLISPELKIDQSVSHNGVCLTIEKVIGNTHQVTAIKETLEKSNLGSLSVGSILNLERCMPMNGRLDGHLVQGHVDCTATCILKKETEGSWLYGFEFPQKFAALLIEKGSVSVNGISLTCFDITDKSFCVAIIPYTFEHTNMQSIQLGSIVNIEFDMIGKYIQRILKING